MALNQQASPVLEMELRRLKNPGLRESWCPFDCGVQTAMA